MSSKVDFHDKRLPESYNFLFHERSSKLLILSLKRAQRMLPLFNSFQYRNLKSCSVGVYANMRKAILSDEFEFAYEIYIFN